MNNKKALAKTFWNIWEWWWVGLGGILWKWDFGMGGGRWVVLRNAGESNVRKI